MEVDTELKVAVLEQKVDSYHKEKNACKDTCVKFGERIGGLECKDAVKTEQIKEMKDSVDNILKRLSPLELRLASLWAGILVIYTVLQKLGVI